MHPKKFLPAVLVAVLALWFMSAAGAAECLPPACAVNESADGGVPDGVFDGNAAAVAASPADPPAASIEAADEPGAAIFNPFADAQDRQKRPLPSFVSRLVDGDHAEGLAIALILALALGGIAAFFFFLRRKQP